MCNFISAIVMKNGDIICDPEHTDSHEDLARNFNLRDGHLQHGRFVRIEYLPSFEDITNLEKWTLHLDETEKEPDWWENVRADVESKMASRVKRMIITDSRDILLGGCWILADNAKVESVKNARIVAMCGFSQVRSVCGFSRIDKMFNSSQVSYMYNSSQVYSMHNFSEIGRMYDSSQVEEMFNSSKICEAYNSSLVSYMYDSSQVRSMLNSSQVRNMFNSSQVSYMYNSSRVERMFSSSKICEAYDSSQVGEVCDLARVERRESN